MKKVLIANRGEIARRVIRTLKKMDIASVAVYSDADKNAPHVLEADEAVYIGASPSAESYLKQDVILEHCKKLGVDGIHPGYGFLSENAEFAEKVTAAGMTFIGPSPEAMQIMGDKLSAKNAVKEYNVPLVPGVDRAITDAKEAAMIIQSASQAVSHQEARSQSAPCGTVPSEGHAQAVMKRANLQYAAALHDLQSRMKMLY